MRTNPPVVVGVDGSRAAVAAALWAAAEARRHGSRLVLATAVPDQLRVARLATPAVRLRELVAAGKRRVEEAEGHVVRAVPQVCVDTEVSVAHPAAMLLERSRTALMVVLGAGGDGDATGGLIGSVRTAVAHHALCPVVVAHPGAGPGPSAPVVLGVDGSDLCASAAAAAFREAELRGVGVVAVHAWSDHRLEDAAGADWSRGARAEQVLLDGFLEPLRLAHPGVAVSWVLRADQPLRSLREAAAGAQLLVVGSRGRGGFASLMLGSTSRALLKEAPCPVMVAPHTADLGHRFTVGAPSTGAQVGWRPVGRNGRAVLLPYL